ncbi:unnamed protein product, partial [Rotaria sp. Silwood2]
APESSDSQPSPAVSPLFDPFQDELDEGVTARLDTKAACPICNKVFSSVHTMIRHKTSIHDRQVRYGCNIRKNFFFNIINIYSRFKCCRINIRDLQPTEQKQHTYVSKS